jgi:hypothetical protein
MNIERGIYPCAIMVSVRPLDRIPVRGMETLMPAMKGLFPVVTAARP